MNKLGKIIVLVVIFIHFFSQSHSEYNLSENDIIKVNKIIVKFDSFIENKGEKYRSIIINKIDLLLGKKGLSEKISSILKEIKQGITKDEQILIEEKDLLYNKEEIKTYWLDLINQERKINNLELYKYDNSLNITSKKWSDLALEKGDIDHKVNPSDSYYDYSKKETWMNQNGVKCKNINRLTFSESIAWGQFHCGKDDCTNEVQDTIKRSFDFYMSEKGKEYKPHYEAIINPYFQVIGLGLSIEETSNNNYTLYLTNHYCTENIK